MELPGWQPFYPEISLPDEGGTFLNAMAVNIEMLLEYVNEKGIRGFISDLWLDLSGVVLYVQRIGDIVAKKHLWKLKVA